MKRSEINTIRREAEGFLAENRFGLPDWASWSLDQWRDNRDRTEYIRERMLGWDITER